MEAGNCHIPYECMYESCRNWNSVAVAGEQAGGAWTKTGQNRAQLWKNSLRLHFGRPFFPSVFSFLHFLSYCSRRLFFCFFLSFLHFFPVLGIKIRVLCLLVLYLLNCISSPGVEFVITWEILVIGSFGKQLACHLQGGGLRDSSIHSLSQC